MYKRQVVAGEPTVGGEPVVASEPAVGGEPAVGLVIIPAWDPEYSKDSPSWDPCAGSRGFKG